MGGTGRLQGAAPCCGLGGRGTQRAAGRRGAAQRRWRAPEDRGAAELAEVGHGPPHRVRVHLNLHLHCLCRLRLPLPLCCGCRSRRRRSRRRVAAGRRLLLGLRHDHSRPAAAAGLRLRLCCLVSSRSRRRRVLVAPQRPQHLLQRGRRRVLEGMRRPGQPRLLLLHDLLRGQLGQRPGRGGGALERRGRLCELVQRRQLAQRVHVLLELLQHVLQLARLAPVGAELRWVGQAGALREPRLVVALVEAAVGRGGRGGRGLAGRGLAGRGGSGAGRRADAVALRGSGRAARVGGGPGGRAALLGRRRVVPGWGAGRRTFVSTRALASRGALAGRSLAAARAPGAPGARQADLLAAIMVCGSRLGAARRPRSLRRVGGALERDGALAGRARGSGAEHARVERGRARLSCRGAVSQRWSNARVLRSAARGRARGPPCREPGTSFRLATFAQQRGVVSWRRACNTMARSRTMGVGGTWFPRTAPAPRPNPGSPQARRCSNRR
jgi:hypothetical protein